MVFHRSVCIMAVLVNSPTGASAGAIANRAGGYDWRMSKGQAERLLNHMVQDGYVVKERIAYRPNMDKVLYHATKIGVDMFRALVSDYDNMEKQLTMEMEGQVS